jgi:uncharacterized protein (TIGR02687 family)
VVLQDKITSYYSKYPELRVLFIFDPDGESREEVEALEPNGYLKVFFENNPFNLKLKFHNEWADEKILLYLPVKRPETHEEYLRFPLLDLLTANRELRLDDVGEIMEEFKLKPMHRSLVEKYKRELKYTSVQKVAAQVLQPGNFEEKALTKALISAFLRFQKPENTELLLAKMLTLGLKGEEIELSRFRNKITENKLMETLDLWVREYFGESLGELSEERIKHLAAKLKYNAITAGMDCSENDPYSPLKINDSFKLNNLLSIKEQALFYPAVREKFADVLEKLTKQVHEYKLVEIYGVHGSFAWLNTPLVSEMQGAAVKKMAVDPLAEMPLLERIFTWEGLKDNVLHINNFLFNTAQTLQQIKQVTNTVLDSPVEYIEKYTSDWYKIDTGYRKAVYAFAKAEFTGNIHVDLYKNTKDNLETAYLNFIGKTNREWLKCLSERNFDFAALNVPLQYNFYQTEIAPLEQKVAVIISDALRYEVAAELLKQIYKESKSEAHLNYCLASIPSTTAIGMTNLLPGNSFEMTDSKITVDGVSSEAQYREQILQTAKPDSRVIAFTQLKDLPEKDKREIFKSPVVYIYHDVIDAIGHKRASEHQTFDSVENSALRELSKAVKYIISTLGVSKVLVTADHGFVYNDRKIEEKDFEPDIPGDANLDSMKNRYGISKTTVQPESGYCVPFSRMNKIKSDSFVLIPDGVNRYHRSGAGTRFVHGGGSLQELVVPVIEIRKRYEKVQQKVNPVLLTTNLMVVSNTLKIQILQENPVSGTERERTINIGLYDGNDLVSNFEEILMKEVSEQPSKRIFSVILLLLPGQAGKSRFTLRVFDPEDPLNRLIEKDIENSTLYGTEF